MRRTAVITEAPVEAAWLAKAWSLRCATWARQSAAVRAASATKTTSSSHAIQVLVRIAVRCLIGPTLVVGCGGLRLTERGEPVARGGERELGLRAQLREQVAAVHRGDEGALHELCELGLARLVEPLLGLGDGGLQGRARAGGGARGVGRGLPLAHEAGDRLPVAGAVGLVEPLHEGLGVTAAGLVALQVGV